MQRNRPPSAQAIKVLRALAADPARWRYGYDLTAEVHLKSGSLYPILVRLAEPRPAGDLLGAWPGKPAAPPSVPAVPGRTGSTWRPLPAAPPPGPAGPSRAHIVRVRRKCPSSFP